MCFNIGDEITIAICETPDDPERLEEIKVQIIGLGNGFDDSQYFCYVPSYKSTRRSFKITWKHCDSYGLDDKFVGEQGIFVTSATKIVRHEPTREGAVCQHCGDFIDLAQTNDVGEFFCYQCRMDPWR